MIRENSASRTPSVATINDSEVVTDAPDGLAVVNSLGHFLRVNRTGARLLGLAEADVIGTIAPFCLTRNVAAEPAGLFDDGPSEEVTTWPLPNGQRREFAYRVHSTVAHPDLAIVGFRDVTDERHRQRRVAAIARSAAKLASQGSLSAALNALAHEILQTDALAAVQVLTVDDGGHGMRIMGSAGFRHWPDFFDRLVECQDRGASLKMLDALGGNEPVIVSHRWQSIQSDPAWAPLHAYLAEVRWDSFASVPLMIRGHAAGVLNAYFAPEQVVGGRTLEFLVAMAEQAAIAVDYASLMQRERDVVRRQERQRLARDLHDSIVQQVFSISMQAKSMEVLAQRDGSLPADAVHRIADEIGVLSRTVLTDLRAMVHELRPVSTTELGGFEEAIRTLIDSTINRTGLSLKLIMGQGIAAIQGDLAEDVYRIIAEAIHNVVKHADAAKATIRLVVRNDELYASISDDGHGLNIGPEWKSSPTSGYGLTTMRERAERWGGTVTLEPRKGNGTIVRLAIPLETGIQVRDGDDETGPR
jgi:signal transduction histidine kinase